MYGKLRKGFRDIPVLADMNSLRGGPQGVSGARCGLRHDRRGQCRKVKSEETKGRERVAGKGAGDECVFIPGEGLGWQIWSPCRAVRGSRGR
jgi:hypothetical protein